MQDDLKNLKIAVVPQDFLTEMKLEFKELKNLIQKKSEEERNSEWIPSVKIPKILNISRKTWSNYRDRKMISYSQIGNKIYVKMSVLEAFMQKNYIESVS